MLKIDYLEQLLVIAIALSSITCAFIQKTKLYFKSSKYLSLYSFIVNMVIGIIFCITFTNISFPNSLWIGFFSYLGADTLYKTLEGKILSHSDMLSRRNSTISKKNLISDEDNTNTEDHSFK